MGLIAVVSCGEERAAPASRAALLCSTKSSATDCTDDDSYSSVTAAHTTVVYAHCFLGVGGVQNTAQLGKLLSA